MDIDELARDADAASERSADLATQGRYDAALTAGVDAVAGYRTLEAADRAVFLPDLASALDGLSSRLGEVGRVADAREAAEEAVALFRELARPAVFGAAQTPAAGSADEAAGAAEADDPALFLPYLAAAMSNLSVRQHETGSDDAALETAREATAIFEDLAQPSGSAPEPAGAGGFLSDDVDQAPMAPPPLGEHSPGLAMALGNLANRLDEAHRGAEALTVSARAAAVFQQLIVVDPDRFRPQLARVINNRAVLLREAGQTAVAISTTRQAVNIYRSLAATRPDVYRDYLAMALGNLANMLSDAGRGRDAIAIAGETTDVYRQLVAAENKNADATGTLADLPGPLGSVAAPSASQNPTAADDHGTAGNENTDAAGTLAELPGPLGGPRAGIPTGADTSAAANPVAAAMAPTGEDNPYEAPLAMSLNNLAVLLAQAHRTDEALAATREAAGLYRRLARRSPQLHLGNLAGALTNLGSDLAEAGPDHSAEALSVTREAVDVTRRLAFGNRAAYLPQLAQAVATLALRLQEADRASSAMASAREAVRLYEELGAKDPDAYEEPMARSRELIEFLTHAAAQHETTTEQQPPALQ